MSPKPRRTVRRISGSEDLQRINHLFNLLRKRGPASVVGGDAGFKVLFEALRSKASPSTFFRASRSPMRP